jgi:hypothetical protein
VFAFISIPKCGWLAQERAFVQVRQTVGVLEDQYISNYNQIQEDSRNGKITDVIAAQRLNEQVLPIINRISAELSRCHIEPESPSRRLQDALIRYFDLNRSAVLCLIEAFTTHNGAKFKESEELRKKFEAMSKELADAGADAWAEPAAPVSPPSVNAPKAPLTKSGNGSGLPAVVPGNAQAPAGPIDPDRGGHERAQMLQLGIDHANRREFPDAVKCFQRAAELGDPMAMNNLGVCFAEGTGVARDATEAAKWYRKAAELGQPLAILQPRRLLYERHGCGER